jgi:excisionase family DNA binding protein
VNDTATALLDVDGAAEFLSISPAFVRKLVRSRRLPVTRIGAAIRFDRRALQRFIEESTSSPERP